MSQGRVSARSAKGLALYGATVVLNGGVSLTAIPIIIALAGANPWASMATGQSIGGSIAVIVAFGWGLTGPATIAMAAPALRPALFLDSLFARGALLIPLVAVQALLTIAIVPHAKPVAFLAGLAMTLAGVSANWYFTGDSRPGRFLVFDTLPRVAGTIVGLLLMLTSHNLLHFALAQLAGSLVALITSIVVVLHGQNVDVRAAARWSRIRASLAEQRHGVVATGLYAAFTPTVLVIVTLASPALLPVFVLADRVSRFVGMAVSPVNQVFQGWVPSATGAELLRRVRLSGAVTTVIAVVAGAAYAALLPLFGVLITHGQVVVEPLAATAFGIITAGQIILPFLTNVGLMAVGQVRAIAISASVGIPVAAASFAAVEFAGGSAFAAWALVAGNGLVIGWQIIVLRRAVRERRAELVELDPRVLIGV